MTGEEKIVRACQEAGEATPTVTPHGEGFRLDVNPQDAMDSTILAWGAALDPSYVIMSYTTQQDQVDKAYLLVTPRP